MWHGIYSLIPIKNNLQDYGTLIRNFELENITFDSAFCPRPKVQIPVTSSFKNLHLH